MRLSLNKPFLLISLALLPASFASANVYTVKHGGRLTDVAQRLGVPLKSLARLNPGLGDLHPGQKIHLPKDYSDENSGASHSDSPSSARKAALKSKRLKAQLAEWKAYKKRRRLKRELAEWKSYKKALARKRLTARKHENSARKKRLAAIKRRQLRQWMAYLAKRRKMIAKIRREREDSPVARRGTNRRSLSDLKRLARASGGGSGSGSGSLVRTALAYRGTRYVFGASGNGAFDCSGFTRFVARRAAGVSLPHSSSEQFGYGHRVSRDDLKPGDLLFFHTDRPGISHVGIYAGNGRFVHAANPRRGVTTDSIHSSYYGSRMVGARRIR